MNSQEALKQAGLKVTLPRVKVLDILCDHQDDHLSAETLYKTLIEQQEEIGLATVYRVLTQFESAGLVVRHRFDDHSVYELNNGNHHDHIVCTACRRVEEFVDPLIQKQQLNIAREMGYDMTDHSLYIYGLCTKCQ